MEASASTMPVELLGLAICGLDATRSPRCAFCAGFHRQVSELMAEFSIVGGTRQLLFFSKRTKFFLLAGLDVHSTSL